MCKRKKRCNISMVYNTGIYLYVYYVDLSIHNHIIHGIINYYPTHSTGSSIFTEKKENKQENIFYTKDFCQLTEEFYAAIEKSIFHVKFKLFAYYFIHHSFTHKYTYLYKMKNLFFSLSLILHINIYNRIVMLAQKIVCFS